jgi:hypothetical protein
MNNGKWIMNIIKTWILHEKLLLKKNNEYY